MRALASKVSPSSIGSGGMVLSETRPTTSKPSGERIARTSSILCGLEVAKRSCKSVSPTSEHKAPGMSGAISVALTALPLGRNRPLRRDDARMNSASALPLGDHLQPRGLHALDQVITDSISDRFVEDSLVAE